VTKPGVEPVHPSRDRGENPAGDRRSRRPAPLYWKRWLGTTAKNKRGSKKNALFALQR